ncbi:hypothetical protein [Nostoc sp. GT001]|jgi:hypothetical protein|uniref:hypothetical protein n=1 Tax=Nostoc sp. GT001 TaxID=3056647 RepID=UPI000E06D0F9|nr:hypothetical protein [Nostoc sp. GT001]MDM9580425.1 hypothetical protein [Nostoc sp. GT001]RCJ21245.1 hypothetical protein A6S26_24455 [Nostoc sp. ATCC 43529]
MKTFISPSSLSPIDYTRIARGNNKMKKLLAGISALGLSITSPGIANAQEFTNFEHQDNKYYYETLNSQGLAYYRYKVPAYTFGIFTLKNHSRSSNVDIYVHDYSGDWKLLVKGNNQGTETELVVTPMFSEDKYAYITIVNDGSQPSEYHLYANYVSPANRFAIALAETSLICSLEKENIPNETSSRVVTGLSSILQGNNLAGVTQDLLINEFTNAMRNQFGYGCTGDFVVNWGVSMFRGVYRNY